MPSGSRGPVPKRSDQRRRRNKPDGAELAKGVALGAEPPDPDPEWHPIAADWFASLSGSGQAQFYEPSDWATARYVAEAMSRNLKQGQKFSSMLFAAVMSGMTELLTTEGARRRARVELERVGGQETPPEVTIMADYRKNVGVKRAG